MKYRVEIYWNNEDEAYIAKMPELPGCVADGQSYQDALAAVETVAKQWIETAQRHGRPIPKPKSTEVLA